MAKQTKSTELLTDMEMITIGRNNMFDIEQQCKDSFISNGSIAHGRLAAVAANANFRAIRLRLKHLVDSKK